MLLRKYEVIVIVNPESGDEGLEKVLSRMRESIEKTGAKEVRLEDWGKRRLAYPLAKQTKGHYLYMLLLGQNTTIAELERLLGITEPALKYQTVLLETRVDAEKFDYAAAAAETTDFGKPASTEATPGRSEEAA